MTNNPTTKDTNTDRIKIQTRIKHEYTNSEDKRDKTAIF